MTTTTPVQSTVQSINSGNDSSGQLKQAEQQFLAQHGNVPGGANPAMAVDNSNVPFWGQVYAGLKADKYTAPQAHDAVRAAQLLAGDNASRDIGQISDMIARDQTIDPTAVQTAFKDSGLSYQDFSLGLEDDLEQINGLDAGTAISRANEATSSLSSSTTGQANP